MVFDRSEPEGVFRGEENITLRRTSGHRPAARARDKAMRQSTHGGLSA